MHFTKPLNIKQGQIGVIATKKRSGSCIYGSLDKVQKDAETRACKIMEETMRRRGHRFETVHVWKMSIVEFPITFRMTLRRLQCLEQHMDKDPLLEKNTHR